VDEIGPYAKPPQSDLISAKNLENLLELFFDTIKVLHLTFVDFFSLPYHTVQAIGRLPRLYDLWLHFLGDVLDNQGKDVSILAYPSRFDALMLEAQGLKSLKIMLPLSLPSIPDLLAGAQYPAITYLKVDVLTLSPDNFFKTRNST
jgi:hypothetical protein